MRDIENTVLRILTEVAPEVEPEKIDPHKSFRDQFDFDSVDFLNFVIALQKELGLAIYEMDYPKLSSLNGCANYLHEQLSKQRDSS